MESLKNLALKAVSKRVKTLECDNKTLFEECKKLKKERSETKTMFFNFATKQDEKTKRIMELANIDPNQNQNEMD
ncbi:unnamed protein product [Chironomus riparius]|uniref:Uncharacterized protein n=1 Tax=Chironomus riparius TaxID=315576 RepID=A0A9N9X1R4_9DIPT|nr:unnamed protein product [Chironomus riparius]